MALTQDRMIALVEESERNIRLIQATLVEASYQVGRTDLTPTQKLDVLIGTTLDLLRGFKQTQTLLERQHIKYTRHKNDYMRDYMRRKRGGKAQVPRLHAPTLNVNQEEMITCDDGTVMSRSEFNAMIDEEMASLPPLAAMPGGIDHKPLADAYEAELARARELGEQERAKNAARLARGDPFAKSD